MLSCQGQAQLCVDLLLFKRIISKLLSNALKYTPQQGRICIEIHSNPGGVHISITDTGIGIAADQVPHIFKRFYRVDASRSLHSGGVGLGLAMVKSIMDLHQGTISVDSQINCGTCIHLYFSS